LVLKHGGERVSDPIVSVYAVGGNRAILAEKWMIGIQVSMSVISTGAGPFVQVL
jgi:hypothetical protein